MSAEKPLEINLRESVHQEGMYRILCEFMTTAMLDESEARRITAAKTLRGILGQNNLWINRGDSVDNQFFLVGEYLGKTVNIYVCDKPKIYSERPAVSHNFDVKNF